MTRLEISNQILEDLKKIKVSRGYNFTPIEVKRGFYKWNDCPDKPCIYFTITGDIPQEDFVAGEDPRWIEILFYGYHDTDGIDNTDGIYNLVQDVENFLESTDFTYADYVFIRDIRIKEGGVNDSINGFYLEARILYNKI